MMTTKVRNESVSFVTFDRKNGPTGRRPLLSLSPSLSVPYKVGLEILTGTQSLRSKPSRYNAFSKSGTGAAFFQKRETIHSLFLKKRMNLPLEKTWRFSSKRVTNDNLFRFFVIYFLNFILHLLKDRSEALYPISFLRSVKNGARRRRRRVFSTRGHKPSISLIEWRNWAISRD